jgi:hypothetical protein
MLNSPTGSQSTIGGPNPKRLTQRRPLVCRACTKSKVRCDKAVPCARCRRRQIPCEREQVQLSSNRKQKPHTPEESFTQETTAQLHDESLRPFIAQEFSGYKVGPVDTAGATPPEDSTALVPNLPTEPISDRNSIIPFARNTTPKRRVQAEFEDLATGIEGLAWGRHQCIRYPHRDCLQIETPCEATARDPLSSNLLESLPHIVIARQLVDFHIRFLCWNHNVLHVPTFLLQCEEFWHSAAIEDSQWIALYCAVLSTAAWSIHNCPDYVDDVAVVNFAHSASKMFDMVIEILNSEKFMSRHTIFSIQAVCICGMVANVFGQSDLLTTLVNASVRIAQCLGLHRILPEEAGEPWDETVDKEVGRRVWWKLVEMDYHSMPYTGTCCINARHFTTRLPLNCDDGDLLDQDEFHLTTSTYSIIMVKMALLIPTLLDGIYTTGDLTSRYEHVIYIDRQMRRVVTKIPSAILRTHETPETEPEWLTLARRTLAIAAADKVQPILRP